MGLRSLLDKLYNTRLPLAIRKELNRKIDNKLNEVIQPLNLAVLDTRSRLNDARSFMDLHLLETLRLLYQNVHEHEQITLTQQYTHYPGLYAALLPTFMQSLTKICGGDHQEILHCGHLLFLELTKGYQLRPGGIWQLNHEIGLFNLPPSSLPKQATPPTSSQTKPRLKILFVSAMFPSIEHGGGLRLFDIVDQLAERHTIDLFTTYVPDLDHHSYGLLQGKLAQVKLVDHEEFTCDTLLAWLASLGRSSDHYDVIQCEYPLSAKLMPAVRPFGRKIGFTFMECVTKSYLIKLRNSIAENDFPNLGQLAHSFWESAVLELEAVKNSDFQIAVTPEDAEDIKRIYGAQPEIIPTCLSPSEVLRRIAACHEAAPEGDTVAFLGYFNHFPNIDGVKWYLDKVHPHVKKQVPGYRFLVIGAGDTSVLQKLSNNDQSVIYTGRVDDIAPHILRGKVCVLPLISGAGIRGKLNQYSMAGRPSVSTTIGNLGLNYQDGEAVLIADTPDAFAAAVVRLLTNEELNQNMAGRAKAYAQANFTWDTHLVRLEEVYRA